MPRSRWAQFLFLMVVSVSIGAVAKASVPAPIDQTYTHSAEGLQQQFAAILDVARSHDEAAFRVALDSLRIPNQDQWFADNFDSHSLPQVSREYETAIKRYQGHITWVMATFGKFDDFGVTTQSLEPPASVGVPTGTFVAPINALKVENFRISSASNDQQHGPPSWVSSFIYIDGKFRYLGGTYTFWDEGLDGVRGPTSLAPMMMHGRSVQGVVGKMDAIEIGPGVDATVQFEVKMDGRGEIHATVNDGDDAFIKDAQDYLKAQNYGIAPGLSAPKTSYVLRSWRAGDPGVTTGWTMEVVFWTPKQAAIQAP